MSKILTSVKEALLFINLLDTKSSVKAKAYNLLVKVGSVRPPTKKETLMERTESSTHKNKNKEKKKGSFFLTLN